MTQCMYLYLRMDFPLRKPEFHMWFWQCAYLRKSLFHFEFTISIRIPISIQFVNGKWQPRIVNWKKLIENTFMYLSISKSPFYSPSVIESISTHITTYSVSYRIRKMPHVLAAIGKYYRKNVAGSFSFDERCRFNNNAYTIRERTRVPARSVFAIIIKYELNRNTAQFTWCAAAGAMTEWNCLQGILSIYDLMRVCASQPTAWKYNKSEGWSVLESTHSNNLFV